MQGAPARDGEHGRAVDQDAAQPVAPGVRVLVERGPGHGSESMARRNAVRRDAQDGAAPRAQPTGRRTCSSSVRPTRVCRWALMAMRAARAAARRSGARRRRARGRRAGHRAARRRRRPRGRPRRPRLRGEPERAARTPGRCAPCAGAGRRRARPSAVAGADALERRRPRRRRGRRRRRQRRDRRAARARRAASARSRSARAGGSAGAVALSAPGARADFAASAVAPSGAAVVVWFRHRGARRWRLEAATREPGRAPLRRARAALGVRAPPVLHERVRRDRGARRRRRDVDLDRAPRGLGGAARRRAALPRGRSGWPRDASDAPAGGRRRRRRRRR